MEHLIGRVDEVRLGSGRTPEVKVVCPESAVPSAGQYLMAFDPADPETVLGIALFLAEKSIQGFWAAPLFPIKWAPGTKLNLVGPLGHGFILPHTIQRLGLITLGETLSRLMPLVQLATQSLTGMTLFTDLPLPILPAALEVYPLSSLKDSLDWPDFLAVDLPLEKLPELRSLFGLSTRDGLPCPAQVLVTVPMPCAGLAECGACAVPTQRGWKYACEDGPVFDLHKLQW